MIEPVVDKCCELILEVWKQCSCCKDVKKSCDSGCNSDNDEHYDELVTCLLWFIFIANTKKSASIDHYSLINNKNL